MPPDLRPLLDGPVDVVAPRLLGATLRHHGVTVRITEVEAYGGADDEGSHAFRGETPRNRVMFGPPGVLYAYLSYGMHVCANVSTGPAGAPSAVLLRAGEVVGGVEVARARRPGAADRQLARGPALLCRTLDLAVADDGADLADASAAGPTLTPPASLLTAWSSGPRVGLRGAPDRSWRFWVTGDPTVSTYRRHPRLARPDPGC